MTTKTVTLLLAKSTTGTHMYQEAEPRPHMQTFPVIYIKKQVFGDSSAKPPESITVTLSFGEVA